MSLARRVRQFNRLLADELGNPPFAWFWSEDLLVDEVIDQTESGLYLGVPIKRKQKLCQTLNRQWVVCRQLPDSQVWYPCTGRLGYCALDPGREVTIDDTWELIRAVRASRHWTKADERNATEEAITRRQKEKENILFDKFSSAAPAFGGRPGKKDHWSFGGCDAPANKEIPA